MGMPAPIAVTSIEELLALPEDGLRHELLDGEHVVTPAPALPHQRVLARIFAALHPQVAPYRHLEFLSSPADIRLEAKTLVQPDLFILHVDPEHPPANWAQVGVPVLAIEILSPSTAARDRGKKRRIYQDVGVGEYWIVDIDARLIERWTPNQDRPEIVTEELRFECPGDVRGTLDLNVVFEGGPKG
jgi:Uma2 family endonuclease